MEEIERLQRHNAAWDILPDRCSAARRALIEIKGASPDLTEDQKSVIQRANRHFVHLEKSVERSIAKQDEPDVAALNRRVSEQLDALQEVLANTKSKVGQDRNECNA